MNRVEYLPILHDDENILEIITASVNAYCDARTDAVMAIDIGFERLVSSETSHETRPQLEITFYKAEDYKPTINIATKLDEEYAAKFATNPKPPASLSSTSSSSASTDKSVQSLNSISTSSSGSSSLQSTQSVEKPNGGAPKNEQSAKQTLKPFPKHKARMKELPSGEIYAVRFEDLNMRKLNFRKTSRDVETAQELPAVREKQEQGCGTNDRTDGDCTSIRTDMANSRESVQYDSKSTDSSPATTPTMSQETATPRLRISLRRRPCRGEFMITGEKNGIVTFSCYTNHIQKKTKENVKSDPVELGKI